MDVPGVEPHISEFVRELLGTGIWLSDLAANLIETLPDDAYPGEDSAAVVLEMLCGTIATVLGCVDPREVERATEIIELARDRTVEHLHLTLEMSCRLHGRDGQLGRTYG